jgi:NitT/TauT family transport system substrate-binding protein
VKHFLGFLLFFAATGEICAKLMPLKLVLNWKPEAEFGGFYEAQSKKIFEKHGFDVTIIPGGPGVPVSQMLESGKVELGIVAADDVVLARARDLSLQGIFTVYQEFPQGIMVHKDRNINSLEELFQSPGELALQQGLAFVSFLQSKFGKNSKVKIVPYVGGIGPFEKNKNYSQQCFVTSEPISAEQKGLAVQVLPIAPSGYNPYTAVVAAKEEWLKQNSKVLKNLYKAFKEGWDSYLKNPTATNKLMHKLNPSMDMGALEKSSEVQKPFILKDEALTEGVGVMTTARWGELAEQVKKLGLVPKIEKDAQNYFVPIWK